MKSLRESLVHKHMDKDHEGGCTIMSRACRDIDGNVYDAVRIGNQVWMAENLRTEHFRNGDQIPLGTSQKDGDLGIPGRYYPANNRNDSPWGYLYNWYAVVDPRGLAPKGWHVPSNEEFEKLRNFLKSNPVFWSDGVTPDLIGKCLATSEDEWSSSNKQYSIGNDSSLNNSTGFNAYPAGFWLASTSKDGLYEYANFWSTTGSRSNSSKAYIWCLSYFGRIFWEDAYSPKSEGCSIRCIKD